MRYLRPGTALIALLALLATSVAWASDYSKRGEGYGMHGELQHRYERLSDFALDPEGTSHEQPYRHTVRARIGAKLSFSRDFWITSTLQLLEGQVLGAESPIPNGPLGEAWTNASIEQRIALRESTLQVPIGLGSARIGRMPIHWGMGLAIHDGESDDSPFDDARGGDVVNGVWFDLTPMLAFGPGRIAHGLHLGFGGDLIERDEVTDRAAGDLAWRIAASVSWDEPWLEGGFYTMVRQIERPNLDRAEHILMDTAWRYKTTWLERFEFSVEGEVAMLTGETSVASPAPEQVAVRAIEQLGAAARVSLKDTTLQTSYVVEMGYASGDEDPTDEVDTAFRFDPARRVGMLLFDEVLSRMSAQRRERLRGEDEQSLDPWQSPTDGAITNALYLAPHIGIELAESVLAFHAGGVVAFALDPLAPSEDDTPVDASARSAMSPLGYELNTSAVVTVDIATLIRFSVGTQYGLFVPGEALKALTHTQDLGVVHKWRLLADLSW